MTCGTIYIPTMSGLLDPDKDPRLQQPTVNAMIEKKTVRATRCVIWEIFEKGMSDLRTDGRMDGGTDASKKPGSGAAQCCG